MEDNTNKTQDTRPPAKNKAAVIWAFAFAVIALLLLVLPCIDGAIRTNNLLMFFVFLFVTLPSFFLWLFGALIYSFVRSVPKTTFSIMTAVLLLAYPVLLYIFMMIVQLELEFIVFAIIVLVCITNVFIAARMSRWEKQAPNH
jgi:hypothetical protein